MWYSVALNALKFDLTHLDIDTIEIYLNYFKNKYHFRGQADFASEILSWEQYYHRRHKEYPTKPVFRRAQTRESILYALDHLRSREHIKCIEVGSGPDSQFYSDYFLNNKNIEIVAVDPLAEFYKSLHRKYNSSDNIEIVAGYGEDLHTLFPQNSFDIVYSQNAIDHSQSPVDFLKNLYNILKPGGYLILHGYINEGSNQGWFGLHKWDIYVDDKDLLLTSQDKSINGFNMTKDMILVSKVLQKGSNSPKYVDGSDIKDTYTMIYTKD